MAFNKAFLVVVRCLSMPLVKALNGRGGFVDDIRFIKRVALVSVVESLT